MTIHLTTGNETDRRSIGIYRHTSIASINQTCQQEQVYVAHKILPQFASMPKSAVFTSAERAIVEAICLASEKLIASYTQSKLLNKITLTRIVTNFVAPSPSQTTNFASSSANSVTTSRNWSSSLPPVISGIDAAPLARIASVSLVLMSPSTEMALNERSTA